jgi:hypothetical protein
MKKEKLKDLVIYEGVYVGDPELSLITKLKKELIEVGIEKDKKYSFVQINENQAKEIIEYLTKFIKQ